MGKYAVIQEHVSTQSAAGGGGELQKKCTIFSCFRCNSCDMEFTLEESLTRHIKTVHSALKCECSLCKISFYCPEELAEHLEDDICLLLSQQKHRFSYKEEKVKYDIKLNLTPDGRPTCDRCDREPFNSRQRFREHYK